MGAVGRILVPGTAEGNHVMFLDLKGTIYKTTLVPSRSFCIVSFGHPEAKEHWMVSYLTWKMNLTSFLKLHLIKLIKMMALKNKPMRRPKRKLGLQEREVRLLEAKK